MRRTVFSGVFLALVALSGCSSKVDLGSICPQTGFIGKTDTITYVAPDSKDVIAKAAIKGFRGECQFKDKKSDDVSLSLTLPFAAQRGEAGAELKQKELPYFIAVLSPDEEVLQRDAFVTTITFDKDGNGASTEEHIVKIPLSSRAEASKYKVAIGFVLTREQYKYNGEPHK